MILSEEYNFWQEKNWRFLEQFFLRPWNRWIGRGDCGGDARNCQVKYDKVQDEGGVPVDYCPLRKCGTHYRDARRASQYWLQDRGIMVNRVETSHGWTDTCELRDLSLSLSHTHTHTHARAHSLVVRMHCNAPLRSNSTIPFLLLYFT